MGPGRHRSALKATALTSGLCLLLAWGSSAQTKAEWIKERLAALDRGDPFTVAFDGGHCSGRRERVDGGCLIAFRQHVETAGHPEVAMSLGCSTDPPEFVPCGFPANWGECTISCDCSTPAVAADAGTQRGKSKSKRRN